METNNQFITDSDQKALETYLRKLRFKVLLAYPERDIQEKSIINNKK